MVWKGFSFHHGNGESSASVCHEFICKSARDVSSALGLNIAATDLTQQ